MIHTTQLLTSDQTNRFQHFPDLNYSQRVGLREPVAIGGPYYLRPRAEFEDLAHCNSLAILADKREDFTNVLSGIKGQWNENQRIAQSLENG